MRVLLLLPAAGYANQDFQQAAQKLGVDVVTCADFCHRLAPGWGLPPLMSVPFDQPASSVPRILAALKNLNLTFAPSPLGGGLGITSDLPACGPSRLVSSSTRGMRSVDQPVDAVLASDDHGVAPPRIYVRRWACPATASRR